MTAHGIPHALVIVLLGCSASAPPGADLGAPVEPFAAPAVTRAPPDPAPAPAPAPAATTCTERTAIGLVTVCGEVYDAPSHGGESSILVAQYSLENRGTEPVVVELAGVDIVDPDGARVPMSALSWSIDRYAGATTTTLPAGATVHAVIDGRAVVTTIRYHVTYHHEARFRVGSDEAVVRAGELYFRHPH